MDEVFEVLRVIAIVRQFRGFFGLHYVSEFDV